MNSDPPFDLVSYARRGPGKRNHLSPGQIEQIARTVRRAPEVMVKVLSRGRQNLKAVRRHLDYLRFREEGEREVETDDGRRLKGDDVSKELLEDWDLDLEEHRHRSGLDARGGGSAKLAHKLMLSMPAGTPPLKVLTAAKNFAREEFGFKHRYAMVLHTDEPHPHVHMVVKAVSEQGERLHIRKATLREWRRGFARHLRNLGVEANATERAVRGATEARKLDGIYRPAHDPGGKRHSTHLSKREQVVAGELLSGGIKVEAGKPKLLATRKRVDLAWRVMSEILVSEGQPELAAQVRRFVSQMPPAQSEKEQLAANLLKRARQLRIQGRLPTTR